MPKYFKTSLSLPNISFTCDNCINTKLTSIESKSIDNIYSLIKSQTDSERSINYALKPMYKFDQG